MDAFELDGSDEFNWADRFLSSLLRIEIFPDGGGGGVFSLDFGCFFETFARLWFSFFEMDFDSSLCVKRK